MDPSVDLDRAIFPYQDIRYTGRGTGARPKVRKDVVLAPNFLKPQVPMPSGVAVPEPIEASDGVVSVPGEATDNVVPVPVEGDDVVVEPTSEVAPCSCGGTIYKSVDGDSVCPNPNNTNTERSVVAYTPPIRNRGKFCNSVVCYSVIR